ncbi:MAG: thioredoxin domain-containing protein [Alphaproteobacteria bacterium]|nr:thioredoxin domain-containing protein [Alphaproteobacteria bacterium]
MLPMLTSRSKIRIAGRPSPGLVILSKVAQNATSRTLQISANRKGPNFMRSVLFAAFVACLLAGLPAVAQPSDGEAFTPKQVENIEKVVHAYLVKHPEVIMEAAEALRTQQEEEAKNQAHATLGKIRADLERDPEAPVMGNPKGDVTVVEFFDYRCGYCKASFPNVIKILGDDSNVRFVMKEYPILAPDSVTAARAALAANKQGKYAEFHKAAMAYHGTFDEGALNNIAKQIGMDAKRMTADMASPSVDAILERNHTQAQSLDLNGTPVFIIGDTIIPGMASTAMLKDLIEKARKSHT